MKVWNCAQRSAQLGARNFSLPAFSWWKKSLSPFFKPPSWQACRSFFTLGLLLETNTPLQFCKYTFRWISVKGRREERIHHISQKHGEMAILFTAYSTSSCCTLRHQNIHSFMTILQSCCTNTMSPRCPHQPSEKRTIYTDNHFSRFPYIRENPVLHPQDDYERVILFRYRGCALVGSMHSA